MKLSTKGRYGLTLMIDLAMNFGEGPVSLKNIAERHDLSDHYLEQLIAPLRNAGLVRSIRGAYGGYVLSKEPKDITAGDVIRVLEGPIGPVECIAESNASSCDKFNTCVKKDLWTRLRDSMIEVLDSTTLADLAKENEGKQDCFMFYI
ncbi:cysteine metabolism transcriptional regulator CymR [Desulfuribacillus alkaliarsenatis]|uniref:Rrf2 family transcriptional regulator n=1 Tax=Desulfuribacillus alkaliarsenatis TaxID=766136 RepID=A0A1E5G0F6_9FIRM|nr:Rrf2 family transcriptional regulator [Desulfuribacillus alkaliarsenatis]OEF96317.1 Rrf2 family transcriptional regulator [Desulfuribacillus alkaliarsenatis]